MVLPCWVSGIVHIPSFTGAEGHLAGAVCEGFSGGACSNCKTSVAPHILAPQLKVNLEASVLTMKAFSPWRSKTSSATNEAQSVRATGTDRKKSQNDSKQDVMVLFISSVKRQITDFVIHRKEHCPTWGEFSDFRLSCALHPGEGQSAGRNC